MQVTSEVLERILKMLTESKVEFDHIIHQAVFTSQEAANIRGTNLSEGVKAILFMADGKPILIAVPGDKKVDTNGFKKQQKIRDLRMLTTDEVKEITGLEVGAIPPIGNAMGVITYADHQVFDKEWMCFNAGSHTQSVRMHSVDYNRLTAPIVGNFAK